MNRLLAIESPKQAGREPGRIEKLGILPDPVAAAMLRSSALVGKTRSGLRVKSPVMVSWLLTIARLWPGSSFDSASALAETTRSQPSSNWALPAAMRTAWISSGWSGDPHMAVDRAALLREAGHVEHGAALAFEMRGHAEQGPDRDDAGAADPGDEDAVRLVERGMRGLGQCRQSVLAEIAGPAAF